MIRTESEICPDWRELAEDRDRGADGEARWRLGLEHAAGCTSCRDGVVAIDPLAIFSLAPIVADREAERPDESGLDEAAEVEAMLQAVTVMRRHQKTPAGAPPRWLPWAAGTLLCVSLGWLALSKGGPAAESPGGETTLAATTTESSDAVAPEFDVDSTSLPASIGERVISEPVAVGVVTVGAALASTDAGTSLESMESLSAGALAPRTAAPRVYRWQDRDLSIVMIVDETLDV